MMPYFGRFQQCRQRCILPLLISLSIIFFLVLITYAPGRHSRTLLRSPKFSDLKKINRHERLAAESPVVLAESRTYRKDPMQGLKYYTGGWDITNDHYWASVSYSALPVFVIAAAWFITFGLTLLVNLLYCCGCCPEKSHGNSHAFYSASLYIFTFASIGGCIFLYVGQEKFQHTTQNTLDYLAKEAGETGKNLTAVVSYLNSAQKIGIEGLALPEDIQNKIIDVKQEAESAGKLVDEQTLHSHKMMKQFVSQVLVRFIYIHIVLYVFSLLVVVIWIIWCNAFSRNMFLWISSIMLVLAVSGFLLSLHNSRCLVYILAVVAWILITATIVISGFFLLLHNMVGDSCVAMEEWVGKPSVYTTLDNILPCVDKKTAEEILNKSKDINQQLVSLVDSAIANVSNANLPPNAGPPLYFNQSGPPVPLLCSPYNADLTLRTCAPGEVQFANATQVWKKYVCEVGTDNTTCITTGRMTPKYYEQAINAGKVSYGLYEYSPFLVGLADCTFVRNTCQDITKNYCWGLQHYTKWIYVNLALVSLSVIFSLFSWLFYVRERSQRNE